MRIIHSFLTIALLACLSVPTGPAAAAEMYTLTLTMPAVPAGVGITHQTAQVGEFHATVPASQTEIKLDIPVKDIDPEGTPLIVDTRYERGDDVGPFASQKIDNPRKPPAPEPVAIPKPAPFMYRWTLQNIPDPEPPQSSTKKLIDSTSLKLIGGWRVPQTHRPELTLTMAFTHGGLAVDGEKMWMTHNHGVQQFAAPKIGEGADYNKWPELLPGTWSDPYSPAREANKAYAGPLPYGLALLDGKLNVSGRAPYASPPPLAGFITREGDNGAYKPAGTTAQQHGGGLCTIPAGFATKHLQGKSIGIGYGGSTSGQGYTAGPSLVAAASISDALPIPLISFGKFDTQDPNLRERRLPDYEKGIEWIVPAKDGVGYWGLDKIKAGPCWIETATRQGVLYWSTQGTGLLSYGPQGEAGGDNLKNKQRLYVYDPDQLAEVAAGRKQPNEMRAKFYEWASCTPIPSEPTNGTTMRGEVVGACWYANRLYLLHRWTTDTHIEKYPVVAVYEVTE